ncbi:MAG: ABC transporter permease, partial [Acidobacteriota bacterium]
MAEVALMVGAASVLAFVLANGVLGQILAMIEEAPFWLRFSPSPRTAAAAALLAAVATLAAGLGPALGATRRHMSHELKAGGRSGGGLRMGRLAATLTILQMAISVAFVGASLAVAQGALRYMDPGIELPTDRILTTQLGFRRTAEEAAGGDAGLAVSARLDAVVEALAAVPGIESVGAATSLPGEGAEKAWIQVEAEAQDGSTRAISVSTAELLPGFLKAVGATPVRGRFFEDMDLAANALPVAVVNNQFVEEVLGQRHALGHRLRLLDEDGTAGPWMEIVGVAPNLGMSPANPELGAGVYVPMQPRRWMRLAMRVEGEPAALGGALRKAVGEADADTTLIRVQPLSKVASEEALTLSL